VTPAAARAISMEKKRRRRFWIVTVLGRTPTEVVGTSATRQRADPGARARRARGYQGIRRWNWQRPGRVSSEASGRSVNEASHGGRCGVVDGRIMTIRRIDSCCFSHSLYFPLISRSHECGSGPLGGPTDYSSL
jgi:hypothetical protein